MCTVDLVDCIRIEPGVELPTGNELAFGDYTPGRYIWKTVNPHRLSKPVPVVGRQGLFSIELEGR